MAGNELKITISAQDNASQVFQKIAKAAETVADNLEKAGKDGGKGFDELADGAETADKAIMQLSQTGSGFIRSMDGVSGSISTVGAGLISLGEGLDSLGRSYLDQQQRLDTLQRQYGEFYDDIKQFSEEMQDQTLFSDDAVQQGLQYFASLREQYGLSIEQIKQLAQVTADLAQANGIGYADAALRVQSAIRGETESAEILGLALNQQSIDRNNLTLTMSNQEAAQFRLNALMDQATYAQGSATAAVERSGGAWRQWTNEAQDAGQAAGEFVGPAGDMISTLGGGLATVGEATRGLSDIKAGLTALGGAVKGLVGGMSTLAAVGGGVALALGAVTAAVAYGVYAWQTLDDAVHSTAEAFESFDEAQQQAILNGDTARAAAIEQAKNDFNEFGAWLDKEMGVGQYATEGGPKMPGVASDTYNAAIASVTKALQDSRVDVQAYTTWLEGELARAYQNPLEAQSIFEGIIETSTNGLDQFAAALDQTAASSQKAASSLGVLREALQGVVDTAAQAVIDGSGNQSFADRFLQSMGLDFGESEKVKGTIDAVTSEWGKPPDASASQDEWLEYVRATSPGTEARAEREQLYKDWLEGQKDLNAQEAKARQEELDARHQYNVDAANADKERADAQREAWEEEREQRQQEIEERRQLAQELISSWMQSSGNDDFVSQLNLAGLGNEYTQLAGDITDASTAIDTVFRVIVGNTNAIKSQAEGVKSWAEELINVEGTLGRIDELMSTDTTVNPYGEALLSADQYKAAQDAYTSIADSTAKIGVNVDAIQAIQAPFIAQFLSDQSDLLENLRQQDEEQQRVTLGWMDTTSAMQAQQAVAMAAAAANGELGASGKAATEAMIEGLVATNPFMEDMLESIGLISVGVDEFGNKTISVNFEGAASTMATLDDLNTSLLMIADLLDNGKLDGSINIAVEQRDLELAKQNLEAVGGQTYTATVNAAVNGAERVSGTKDDLDDFVAKDGVEVGIGVNLDDEGVDQTMRNLDDLMGMDGTTVHLDSELTPPPPPDVSGMEPVQVPATLSFSMGEAAGNAVTNAASKALGGAHEIPVTASVTSIDTSAIPADLRIPVSATVISVDTSAMSDLPSVDVEAKLTIVGDATSAGDAYTAISTLPDVTKTLHMGGDVGQAIGSWGVVSNLPDVTKTLTMVGDAGQAIATWGVVNDLPDVTKTITFNIVTNGSIPSAATARHGGIPAYATGGVLFEAGEAGPELAHFANGGVALIPNHALYLAPQGTQIEPSNSAVTKLTPGGGLGGGRPIYVQIYGNVYGLDDLEVQVGGAVVRALAEEKLDRDRALGVQA